MIRALKTLLAVVLFATPVFAAEDENILVIEIAGEANGIVEIELLPELAPKHVERIKNLARAGAYDNVVFHRVLEGFMAQTGDVEHGTIEGYKTGLAGTGSSDMDDLKQEFSPTPYVKGTVGMARSRSVNSGNSQFFIMFTEYPSLNGQYTVFGQVLSGQEVVDSIKRATGDGSTLNPDYMKSVTIKGDKAE